ncbi:MAG: hypothetical protein ACLQD8_00130 [Thermoplasmata archaeon]
MEAPAPGRTARFAGVPERFLVPLQIAAGLFLAATLLLGMAGWLKGASLGILLGVGGGALLASLLLELSASRSEPAPTPSPSPSRTGYESAFVCAHCSEYTPPPDWEALLQDTGPVEAADVALPTNRAFASLVGSVAGAWDARVPMEIGQPPVGGLLSAPETAFLPPSGGSAPPRLARGSDLMLFQGRLTPVPLDGSSVAISGGRRTSSVPRAPPIVPAVSVPRPETERQSVADPPEPLAVRWLFGDGTSPPSLDLWIRAEVEGIVTRTRAAVGFRPDPDTDFAPSDTEPSAGSALVPDRTPCASCKQTLETPTGAVQCADCRRPICDPCRERVVEHDGTAWCAPCAVNRLSTEFLGVLEGPPELSPAPDSPLDSRV